MTVRYVGPGGNNSNDGLSWAQRKLTLNGVEDTPVQAGDVIYCGPGVYRETLTCDVSGSDGNPITYIGDVTGEHTDGVGGVVRITGSDNDQTYTRWESITATGKNYRTIRGFWFDLNQSQAVTLSGCTNWIIEDCITYTGLHGVSIAGASGNIIIRRCVFWGGHTGAGVTISHSSAVDDANILIENCLGLGGDGVSITRYGGVTVRNCTFTRCRQFGVGIVALPNAGQTVTVVNCIIAHGLTGLSAPGGGTGYIVEDYNLIYNCTARSNTNTGANSNAYSPLLALPLLHAGQVLPAPPFGTLSEWSQVKRIAQGTALPNDDLFGRTRPETSAKKSLGAVQHNGIARETTTIDGASGASLKLDDAGRVQWRVPVTAASTTISVKVYREADYAGTLPQMVIKQPGQADRTTTDAAAAGQWNTLTDTFTPAAAPPYVVVELVSNNTAGSGNYDTFFDTLSVS